MIEMAHAETLMYIPPSVCCAFNERDSHKVMRTSMRILAAALLVAAVVASPAPPLTQSPVWTADLKTDPYTVWTSLANDYALYSIVNNTVTAYSPFTGAVTWTTMIRNDFVSIVAAVNNKWLIVETGTDVFVLSALSGSIASHTKNDTYATILMSTQFDDVFFADDDGAGLHVEQVMPDGVLQRLAWSASNYASYGVVPNTPYFYVLDDTSLTNSTLTFTNMHDWTAFSVANVANVAPTPSYGCVAVAYSSGVVSMIDVMAGTAVWSNPLKSELFGAVTIFLIQTSGSVIAVSTFATAMSPMFVMDATTGELLGNHSNEAGVWAFMPQAFTIAAGRIVLIARETAITAASSFVVSLDPTNGKALSAGFTPTLSPQVVLPIGGSRVVVPNSQGFSTFSATDTSVPLTYNLQTPGATTVVVFSSPVSADVFVLCYPAGFSAFSNSP
jgi:hypothetical protein